MFLDLILRKKGFYKARRLLSSVRDGCWVEEEGRDLSITKMDIEVLYCPGAKPQDLTLEFSFVKVTWSVRLSQEREPLGVPPLPTFFCSWIGVSGSVPKDTYIFMR